jgi:mycothiol synthase
VTSELRPARRADAGALANMFERFGRTYGADLESAADLETWFDNPGIDLEQDTRVALLNGRIVGYGDASDAAGGGKLVLLDVRSDPAHRKEAEPVLLDFLDRRARELAHPGGVIKVWAPKDAGELRALIEARGYSFDRFSFRMGIDLDRELPMPEWPAGMSVRTFRRDEDTQVVYDVHQEAFSEEPDYFRDPFDEWEHWSFRVPFDPELWFLAFDGEELAGICLCRPTRGNDSDCGWVQVLGVRKPWRRRGIGLALLRHSLREFRKRGKRRASLGVDGASEEALRLYENAEMAVERTSAWYRKNA